MKLFESITGYEKCANKIYEEKKNRRGDTTFLWRVLIQLMLTFIGLCLFLLKSRHASKLFLFFFPSLSLSGDAVRLLRRFHSCLINALHKFSFFNLQQFICFIEPKFSSPSLASPRFKNDWNTDNLICNGTLFVPELSSCTLRASIYGSFASMSRLVFVHTEDTEYQFSTLICYKYRLKDIDDAQNEIWIYSQFFLRFLNKKFANIFFLPVTQFARATDESMVKMNRWKCKLKTFFFLFVDKKKGVKTVTDFQSQFINSMSSVNVKMFCCSVREPSINQIPFFSRSTNDWRILR